MKTWIASLLMASFLALSAMPAMAVGEKTFAYDTSLRMVFGLGQGKKSVRQEEFGKFLEQVITPAFQEGYCAMEARGQWIHPEKGLIRERNVVIWVDIKDGEQSDALVQKVIESFLKRFPGSQASVYVVKTPGINAKIYF